MNWDETFAKVFATREFLKKRLQQDGITAERIVLLLQHLSGLSCKNYRLHPKFLVDSKYDHCYFTLRETEAMLYFIQGKTIKAAAHAMGLSPRTVEYYLHNMKGKLHCRTKAELINKVLGAEFLYNLIDSLDGISKVVNN